MRTTPTTTPSTLITPLAALALCAAAGCFPSEGPYSCPYTVSGSPDQFTLTPGKQPGGYVVTAPRVCEDDAGSIEVSASGADALDKLWADRVADEVHAALPGLMLQGPALRLPNCAPASSAPLRLFNIGSWGDADALVKAVGAALIKLDLSGTMAVEVGRLAQCD